MNIISFKETDKFFEISSKNDVRKSGFSCFKNIIITGRNSFYPNVLFRIENNDKYLISPYDEIVMSLKQESFYQNNIYNIEISGLSNKNLLNKINDDVFFFIYNFDNYYHFLYDTIPYLYFYIFLKNKYPCLKLLVNYPNVKKNIFYNFNIDILNKYIDIDKDLIIHNDNNIYDNIFVSTSLTHGGFSNLPPNNFIYEVYSKMTNNIKINPSFNHKYIYISRRTWINNDISNIGTNYTTRRMMVNEDKLVEELNKLGFMEIFAENLSIDKKIQIFNNAEFIVGSIGGGMSNLLFSKQSTKSVIIVTPYFLEINGRFRFCMENTNFSYFYDVETVKNDNDIPLYCRVRINNIKYKNLIGEIVSYDNITKKYKINISNNDVAGFNNDINFITDMFLKDEFSLLDYGLNSPYIVNIPKIISCIKNKINDKNIYSIINQTKNIEYHITIDEIFKIIKDNSTDIFVKIIDNKYVTINNSIILNTKFICHRINTIDELKKIPPSFGVEIDIRDDYVNNNLHISHDPFYKGIDFDKYLKEYNHDTIILNIKSERTEIKCIDLMNKFNINNYFFLDSSIPMIYLLNTKYNNNNIACRYSEYEPIEFYLKIKEFISWVWIDCFTKMPIDNSIYEIFKNDNKKICLVSPELQNQKYKIYEYRDFLNNNNIIPNAICCKYNNIIYWI
jgi:capsular polysaccharide biosynthesis protein